MHNDVPDCFCPDQDQCDWVVEVAVKYHRPSDPDSIKSVVDWKLENIPQALAQVIVQASVSAVNEKSADVYTEWLKACHGDDSPIVKHLEK